MENEITRNNIEESLKHYNNKSFEKYREFIDNTIKLNEHTSIFYLSHLENFLAIHYSKLDIDAYYYKEKLFYYALELKSLDKAEKLLFEFKKTFGNETKIIRMQTAYNEMLENYDLSLNTFKNLIKLNQDDRISLKRYLAIFKLKYNLSNIKDYTEILNEYLKIYMDDVDIWAELSDIYLLTNNYNKALFCLEEILLFFPNNYMIYTKIGDILSSFNNTESAQNALKYYSQSILINPSLNAFWGIYYASNIILKYNKSLDEKSNNLLKIAKINIMKYYENSPFKKAIEEISV